MNKELIYFQMQMLQAEIEMQGMMAENKRREMRGESHAYTQTDFDSLIEKHRIHHNAFPFQEETIGGNQ